MIRLLLLGCSLAAFATGGWGVACGAEPLLAGVAVADVTPPVPYRMSGYFNERLSTGVKDPLRAKVVVLRQGEVQAALAFCDLIGIPAEVSARVRQRASKATGIPAENIVVAATHSHTGPLYYDALRDHFHQRTVERLGSDPHEAIDYPAELATKVAAAIESAHAALAPVELKAGFAHEKRLAFNRRFLMKDGTVRFNPGQLNPDVVRPVGPIDPQVGVISLAKPGAPEPYAALVSFALHLDTTSGTEYSADYPYYMERRLREAFGPRFTALFGAGTCGDINHIDVATKQVRTAEQIGEMLAETVEHGLKSDDLAAIVEPMLAVRSVTIDAPLQQYSVEEVAQAQADIGLVGSRELPFLDQVAAYKIVDLQSYDGPTAPLEVQVVRLSDDVAMVTLPTEVFVELGLAIKAASPFKTTLVIELANDSLGYIPTKKAFAEGSYETVNSRVQPGSGEQLVKTAIDLLKEMK